MTTIQEASVEAAKLAVSRIADSEDIQECDVMVTITHAQGVRNVKVHMVALADGGYNVESVEDVENIYRGEVIL